MTTAWSRIDFISLLPLLIANRETRHRGDGSRPPLIHTHTQTHTSSRPIASARRHSTAYSGAYVIWHRLTPHSNAVGWQVVSPASGRRESTGLSLPTLIFHLSLSLLSHTHTYTHLLTNFLIMTGWTSDYYLLRHGNCPF